MTDLRSKTVEELCTLVWTCGGSKAAAYELVHRLEEAQQKIVAQQAFLSQLRKVFARRFPMCRDCADEAGTCPNSGLPCEWPKSYELTAQDAEVAAKALDMFAHGWGKDDEMWMAADIKDIAAKTAAEYRAKAGRKE